MLQEIKTMPAVVGKLPSDLIPSSSDIDVLSLVSHPDAQGTIWHQIVTHNGFILLSCQHWTESTDDLWLTKRLCTSAWDAKGKAWCIYHWCQKVLCASGMTEGAFQTQCTVKPIISNDLQGATTFFCCSEQMSNHVELLAKCYHVCIEPA